MGYTDDIGIIKINDVKKNPHVYFEIYTLHQLTPYLISSKIVVKLNFFILITPAEKYTPYEIFFLPFDLMTWIFSLITFLSTILSILIINNLSKSTQTMVYGHKVDTPFWNVISIFFGISQTKLPNTNFSRFILIIFIYFCLIFRTCFQSKFFEFMTSEPRHPQPKTFGDLINEGYKLYTMEAFLPVAKRNYLINWPEIFVLSAEEYNAAYLEQSQNSSAKMALIVDEFATRFIDRKLNRRTNNWTKLDDFIVFAFHETFFFFKECFYFRMFDRIIDDLIPTGIINHLIENNYTKPWEYDQPEVKPKVLTLDDLAFGFIIWLIFCLISFIGFIVEHIAVLVLKPIESYAAVHPINPKLEDEVCIGQITTYDIVKGINPELIEKFRVKKQAQAEVKNDLVATQIIEDIELIDLENLH
ncbi:hypothetical protein ACKWTF_004599 [Chironomus riparius]